jgi:GDSL-like Lipase/Acylhydrolase family
MMQPELSMHVVLLGDSILDNGAYTEGEPDVVTHLRRILPDSERATLCAIDGSTTEDLASQVARVPSDVSHLVISIGGNDALDNIDLLGIPVKSTLEALSLFHSRINRFEASYRTALETALALQRPTAVCTIYNGNLEPALADAARILLMLFNDAILRFGFERGLDLIDLRIIFNEKADYANPIEPSGQGGLKIARAITKWLGRQESKQVARVHSS